MRFKLIGTISCSSADGGIGRCPSLVTVSTLMINFNDLFSQLDQESTVKRLIQYAFDKGINFFNFQGLGDEMFDVVAKSIHPFKEKAIISLTYSAKQLFEFDEARISYICTHLKIIRIDFVILDCNNEPDLNVSQSILSLKKLLDSGKINGIGLSNVNKFQIEQAHSLCPVAFVQNEYDPLCDQQVQKSLIDKCRQLDISFSPIIKLDQMRSFAPCEFLDDLCLNKNITARQLILALLIQQGHILSVNVGSEEQLQEVLESSNINFTQNELYNINMFFLDDMQLRRSPSVTARL